MPKTIKGMLNPVYDALEEGFLIELDERDRNALVTLILDQNIGIAMPWDETGTGAVIRDYKGLLLAYVYYNGVDYEVYTETKENELDPGGRSYDFLSEAQDDVELYLQSLNYTFYQG